MTPRTSSPAVGIPRFLRQRGRALIVMLCIAGCALIVFGLVGGNDRSPTPPTSVAGPGQNNSRAAESPRPRDLASPTDSSSAAPTASPSVGMAHSLPVEVEIPGVRIQSKLLTLGLEADNTVEVPADEQADQAGWYRHSPTPGEIGPAVIIGHVDSKTGPAVFYRLNELQRGDAIRVRRADGAVAVFKVDKTQSFSKESFPTEEVYGDIDYAGLRLITCSGSYDRENGGYQANTVVFASLSHIEQARS